MTESYKACKGFQRQASGISQGPLRAVLFAAVAARMPDDKNTSLGTVLGEDCKVFREHPTSQGRVREAPTYEDLVEHMPGGYRDRRNSGPLVSRAGVAPVLVQPGMIVSEYDRLLGVLTEVPHMREGLLTSGMDLTRAQSELHESSEGLCAKAFDTEFNPKIILSLPAMADMHERMPRPCLRATVAAINSSDCFSRPVRCLQRCTKGGLLVAK
jgi:hypothetical protein